MPVAVGPTVPNGRGDDGRGDIGRRRGEGCASRGLLVGLAPSPLPMSSSAWRSLSRAESGLHGDCGESGGDARVVGGVGDTRSTGRAGAVPAEYAAAVLAAAAAATPSCASVQVCASAPRNR